MKVAIISGGISYHNMFRAHGWDVVFDESEADLICFTGGEDVTPALYGEGKHPYTGNNPSRDKHEQIIFERNKGKKMVGICRGAQFLHVMCGGSLWQDVDNHALSKTHECLDVHTGQRIQVTSTHHQMMKDDGSCTIVALAANSTKKEGCTIDGDVYSEEGALGELLDLEVVRHGDDVLCFQPHPEFHGATSTRDYFFELLERELSLSPNIELALEV